MIGLKAKIRKVLGRKTKRLRSGQKVPAVLYGPTIKENILLEVDEKEFEKVLSKVGKSTLLDLEVEGKTMPVLIHEVQRDPLTERVLHIDFYQPRLDEAIEVTVPLVFEGVAPAVKDLGGTLVKNITEIEIKALPQNLPHEIKVNIESLETFDDEILIKDLKVPVGVKVLREPNEIVAKVVPPEKVEEELEKPIEEAEEVKEVKEVEEEKEAEEEKEETKEEKEGEGEKEK